MTVINLVLASGAGSRLYPLSTEEKPKQFLKLLSNNMMVEDTINRFKPLTEYSFLVTLEKYRNYVEDIEDVNKIYEPERKESARSVYYALKEIATKFNPSETVIIQSPSDQDIDTDTGFIGAIHKAIFYAEENKIAVLGVKPRKVVTDYGYIKDGMGIVQKPSESKAVELIKNDYYWNTAIYAYLLRDMLQIYEWLYEERGSSFEDEIIKKVPERIKVIPSLFYWEDIGDLDRVYAGKRWERKFGKVRDDET